MAFRKRVLRADLSDELTHRSALSTHSFIHVRKDPYVNQQWGKSPRVEECLSTHNEIHNTGKICDRGKRGQSCFQPPTVNMTHPRDKRCECHPRWEGLLHRSELRNPNPMHTGEKPDECGKAFSLGFSLDSMRPCTQERNHMNDPYCDKPFNQRSDLRKTGERPSRKEML